MEKVVPSEVIDQKILLIRGQKVMLDRDLAALYGVTTGNLNKAVKRNSDRFPEDFMFQLSGVEFKNLIFHFGRSSWGGARMPPYVFTEHGILMLSSVLNSRRAVQVNIVIMRTFVKLRQIIATHKELTLKLADLERKLEKHDVQIHGVFEAIRKLMEPLSEKPKAGIGFHVR